MMLSDDLTQDDGALAKCNGGTSSQVPLPKDAFVFGDRFST